MRRSLVLAVLVASIFASPAVATPPLILFEPKTGVELPLGWTGPVEIYWEEEGEMKLEVTGPGYSFALAPITVTADDRFRVQGYTIDPLPAVGTYSITAGRADGSETSSTWFVVPPPNDATIVTPIDGGAVLFGWRGPLRIRWDSITHPQSAYVVGVDGTPACGYAGSELTPGTVTTCTLGWVPDLGSHTISVEEPGVETFLLSGFEVEPHLSVAALSAAPYRFYPYVRDGYRDRTVLRFALNKEASVVVRVRNGAGRTVRRVALGLLDEGSWAWNGRTDTGSLVPTGRYKVVLEARALGETRRWVREVVVARGWVTRRATKERCGGCGPGAYQSSPRCHVNFDVYHDGDVFLDCWGGDFAMVAWRFQVPANAFNIRKRVVGEVMCCPPGGVVSAGARPRPRTYVVAAGVSGWRSWDIRRVRISYSYKVRI